MKKANPLDRALLHGLHQRLDNGPERISDAAIRAVIRVAVSYTQTVRDDDVAEQSTLEEFDDDSLALVEILMLTVMQLKAACGTNLRVELG